MRPANRFRLTLTLLAGLAGVQGASAQYYDDGYDRPPRPDYGDERYARPASRRAVGLNCDAVQSGLSGFQPFSCPLPGPRPLGARCFCDMPIAPLSSPQTAVGRVVP